MKSLLSDAAAAGYAVRPDGDGFAVFKKHKRSGAIVAGILIFPDRSAMSLAVHPSVAGKIRGLANLRRALCL